MKRLFTVLILFMLALTSCTSGNAHENEARAPKSGTELKGKDYKDVVTLFEESGFTNIETEKIEDLITGWLTKDGEVESVSIGGETDYSTSKWYLKNSKVRISYHTFPEKDIKSDTEQSINTNEQYSSDYFTVQMGDYYIDVPTKWKNNNPHFFAEKGVGVAQLYYDVPEITVTSFEALATGKDSYFEAILNGMQDISNANIDEVKLNGNNAYRLTFESTIQEKALYTEVYLLHCPTQNKMLSIMIGQTDSCSKDYLPEFKSALETLRLDKNNINASPKPTVNTEKQSNISVSTETVETIDVYTIDNCEDLANLLTSEYINADAQSAFVSKYKGEKIEFDAVVGAIFPDENNDWLASYVFAPDLGNTVGCALFMVENAVPAAFKWDKATRPEYLSPGSKVRIQAEVETGDDALFIYLRPIKTWGR